MLASGDRLLRVKEFAEALGLEPDTCYRWISAGRIKAVRIAGSRAVRIPSAELKRLASVQEFDAAATA